MLEFVEVALGKGGGVACGRCRAGEAPHYRQTFEILAEVQAACDAWGSVPGPNVALGGPEPFGHRELRQLLDGAVAAGVKRLRLDTDATALADPGIASAIVEAGVRHIRVTLLGGSGELHDGLCGERGAFERSLAGMHAYTAAAAGAGAKTALSARVPVCRHDCHELPGAVLAAVEAGARYVLLDIADAGLDIPAAMPWIGAACDSGTVNCAWVEVAGLPYCFAGDYALHLVPVMRPLALGEKAERCVACRLDASCGGVPAGSLPQVKAALAPPAEEARLAESIERAYLSPTGPGELE